MINEINKIRDDYKYSCSNKSYINGFFEKYYFPILARMIPRRVTANIVSIISSLFMFLVLAFSGLNIFNFSFSTRIIIFILFMHLYMVGDCLDGTHAKNTKTSSPLGEFIDHYLDIFNGFFIVLSLLLLFDNIPNYLILLITCLHLISFIAVYVDQRETGIMKLGVIGSWEGSLSVTLILILLLIKPTKQFLYFEIFDGFPVFYILLISSSVVYISTVLVTLLKHKRKVKDYAIFNVLNLIIVIVLIFINAGIHFSWSILLLFGATYVCSLIGSNILENYHSFIDYFTPSMIVLYYAVSFWVNEIISYNDYFFVCLIVYQSILFVIISIKVLSPMKTYWQWLNPKKTF